MMENCDLVQKGFRVLHPLIAGYIGMELHKVYKEEWWVEVLNALNDQRDLPLQGDYNKLIDSLDMANCLRLIDREWNELFRQKLPLNVRTWAKELMGVRNVVAHLGQQDISQADAERALDTMARLCEVIDDEGAMEIRKLYNQVRFGGEHMERNGDLQAQTEKKKLNLLALVGTKAVQKTTLTRKISYAGKTTTYPVYKVSLDLLYYNDQNDRIATWITRYRSEYGEQALAQLEGEAYNRVIENFIYESNPESIQKTQKNIALVGQREPGVALADGRLVDGNRRFTCLRRLQRESKEPIYYETVIMDVDIHKDKKQIKLLELAIQHGEEKKVDYDQIDYAIGTYMDVEKTKLLTIEEYAESTNETIGEVKKRIETAELICEFLKHIGLPGQYHVAREMQVYSVILEILAPIHQLRGQEREQLKAIAFNNVLLRAIIDNRKFLRDIKSLIKNDTYTAYFAEQMELSAKIRERYEQAKVSSKDDLDRFANENGDLAEELQLSLHKAMLRSRKQQLMEKPSENVSKCISLMAEIDSRMFGKMDDAERFGLKKELETLNGIVGQFGVQLGGQAAAPIPDPTPVTPKDHPTTKCDRFVLAPANPAKPYVVCASAGNPITRFFVAMRFRAIALGERVAGPAQCKVFFVDKKGNVISDIKQIQLEQDGETTVNFAMRPESMNLNTCNLVIQDDTCDQNEALVVIPFELNISSGFRR